MEPNQNPANPFPALILFLNQKLGKRMKYFIGINFLISLFLLWSGGLFGGGWIGFKLLILVFNPLLPAMSILSLFSVQTCSGDFICGPTLPVIIVTFIFFLIIFYLISIFDNKIITDQNHKIRKGLYSFVSILILFNIGGFIPVIQSQVEKYNNRTSLFSQELNKNIDLPSLGFSVSVPSDWVESKYKSREYVAIVPQRLEEKSKQFMVISPSYSVVSSHYISTTIYEVVSGYKTNLFCGGGFKKTIFAGRSAIECVITANGYEYGKLIRITDLSNLSPSWKDDNLIWYILPNQHKNLVPLYESVLSTFSFQQTPKSESDLININTQANNQKGIFLASSPTINFTIKKGFSSDGAKIPEEYVMFSNDPFDATALKNAHWKSVISEEWIDAAREGTANLAYRVGINYRAYELPVGEYKGSITYSSDLGSEFPPQTVEIILVVEN